MKLVPMSGFLRIQNAIEVSIMAEHRLLSDVKESIALKKKKILENALPPSQFIPDFREESDRNLII